MDTLGKRIAQHRKELGLTQDQLAEKLGITAQAVSKWENDLSCPDISILPKLADIFSTTTDSLLGREQVLPACDTTIVTETENERGGFSFDNGKMNLHWDGGKKDGIIFGCWILLCGIVYLITQLMAINISFWNVLWPTFLLVFGCFGIFPIFSTFRLSCALAGGIFLATQFLPIRLEKGIIVAGLVVLLGFALLSAAVRKEKRSSFSAEHTDNPGKKHRQNPDHSYHMGEDHFTYEANFGSNTQLVQLDTLRSGNIEVNFGEFVVDLSRIRCVDSDCALQADCNFGSLTILVPRKFAILHNSSSSFSGFEISGQADPSPQGTIRLHTDASFGHIKVQYT